MRSWGFHGIHVVFDWFCRLRAALMSFRWRNVIYVIYAIATYPIWEFVKTPRLFA